MLLMRLSLVLGGLRLAPPGSVMDDDSQRWIVQLGERVGRGALLHNCIHTSNTFYSCLHDMA